MNVVLFGLLLFLGLAIIGVQFFQGKFHRCYAPPVMTPLPTYGKDDCLAAGYSCKRSLLASLFITLTAYILFDINDDREQSVRYGSF
jgi:hypothetical protein